ncbi:MAG TPA: DedA family protein [Treponemataceae bacterium]|nr:DedA family protein [Treponemataceae bacterium]
MGQFGYAGIALLIAIENIFPPIPSEVILTFGGFMTTYTTMNVWLVILSATVGSVIGAIALYAVGRLLNPERLQRWVRGRIGRFLHFKAEDISRADHWFQSKGKSTVFFCRFIPIVRSLISIPAGMAGMGMVDFLLLTAAGSAIWNLVLVWLGVFAGGAWAHIAGYMDIYSKIALVVLTLAFLAAAYFFYKARIKKAR